MTEDKGILIKNIYYMLSYAFDALRELQYKSVEKEKFDETADLLADILAKGVSKQLKQGLYRTYVTKHENLICLRGKLDMPGTVRERIQRRQRLACEFDELSGNNLYNQILKTTMYYLAKVPEVKRERKHALQKNLVFFDGISLLSPSEIPWDQLHYQRNNRNYELLLHLCYFALAGMLQTTESGEYKMVAFDEARMHDLYERFILAYYRRHHSELKPRKANVAWNLVGDNNPDMVKLLPQMQTDIFLQQGERILILDAKYYTKSLIQRYEKQTLHSSNLYQIFSYVKNQDKGNTGNVAGILVYAKTSEAITPDCRLNIGGNIIGATTLDLNCDFQRIAKQLDDMVVEFFGGRPVVGGRWSVRI